MSLCTCGYSTDYPDCNGTHRAVRRLREEIAQAIEAIDVESSVTNAVGTKILAVKIARNQND